MNFRKFEPVSTFTLAALPVDKQPRQCFALAVFERVERQKACVDPGGDHTMEHVEMKSVLDSYNYLVASYVQEYPHRLE
jgi:hypothetical protein